MEWIQDPDGVPQRERVTYLTHLQQRLGRHTGITTAFATINRQLVLNIIPLRRRNDPEPPRRALTVGCLYHREAGEWWFFWVTTSTAESGRFAAANEMAMAEHVVLAAT